MNKVAAIYLILGFVGIGCVNIPNLPKAAYKRKGPLLEDIDNAYQKKHINRDERDEFRERVHSAASDVEPID
jgi:hypothetical protein